MRASKAGLLMAALALGSSSIPVLGVHRRELEYGDKLEPTNSGRRAEKEAVVMEKAEAKRARKAAKRIKQRSL